MTEKERKRKLRLINKLKRLSDPRNNPDKEEALVARNKLNLLIKELNLRPAPAPKPAPSNFTHSDSDKTKVISVPILKRSLNKPLTKIQVASLYLTCLSLDIYLYFKKSKDQIHYRGASQLPNLKILADLMKNFMSVSDKVHIEIIKRLKEEETSIFYDEMKESHLKGHPLFIEY